MPFSGCTSLTQIAVASGNKNFAIVDNMLVTKDGHNLIQVPAGIGATCTVPDGVTTIWGEAFIPGDLKTVILSSTVTNVQTAAFMNCYSLTTIKVASGNTAYAAVDGVLYSKDKTELYYYPQGKSIPEAYTMPDGVETVKAMAFFGKGGLKALILPAGLKTFEIQAFAACSDLLNVTIPASATEIRYGAFEWCDNLNTVNFLGTKEQWNNVNIGEHNEPLTNAKIIYGGGSADVGTPVISSVKAASDSVTVKWGAVSGADKYQVQRKASDGSWETLKTVTAISYTDKSPLMGTSKYRVRAYGYGAWGSWSSAKSVTFNPFTDVESSGKTFEYISWAYNNGIVTGTSATTFSPGNTCTRIQFVMMLWKMHGSPVVGGENPFSDISGTKTTNAILWALDVGIINSGSTFNPSGSITRVNIVMMLWKLAGSPKVSGSNPFTDVSGAKTINAVLWAYQNGITKGTSDTTFSPNKNCTRLQLVTFQYKYNNIYNVI